MLATRCGSSEVKAALSGRAVAAGAAQKQAPRAFAADEAIAFRGPYAHSVGMAATTIRAIAAIPGKRG